MGVYLLGGRGGSVGWGTELEIWKSWVRFSMGSLEIFLLTQSFPPHYGPRVDSVSNIKEYQEYFLLGKGGR